MEALDCLLLIPLIYQLSMNVQPPPQSGGPVQRRPNPLDAYGFVLDEVSADRTSGHLLVTSICCQPFGVLHGGVSALIAEDLASYGAAIASGYNRVAGVQMSINHVKGAVIGDLVIAEAAPLKVGRSVQVWNVRLSKCDPSNSDIKTLISTSSVTLFCNFTPSESDKDAVQRYRKHANL